MKGREHFLGFLIIGEAIILVLMLVLGLLVGRFGFLKKGASSDKQTTVTSETDIDPMASTASEEELPEQASTVISDSVRAFADGMSIEQKVAQLILASPEALTGVPVVDEAGNITDLALQQYPVAGLVYSARNYNDKAQFETLLSKTNNMYSAAANTNLLFMAHADAGENDRFFAQTTFSVSSFEKIFEAADLTQVDMTGITYVYDSNDGDSLEARYLMISDQESAQALTEEDFSGILIGQIEASAVELIQAGCDMIYVTDSVATTYDTILAAVNDGTISQDRLDEAVLSILSAKEGLTSQGLAPVVTSVDAADQQEDSAAQEATTTTTSQPQPASQAAAASEAAVSQEAAQEQSVEDQAASDVATEAQTSSQAEAAVEAAQPADNN